MRQAGYNMELVKRNNRSSVLQLLYRKGAMSRKDIATELGLTPATVTQICTEFMQEQVLEEKGTVEEECRAGRKKILVNINPTYKYIIGINIEPEQTSLSVATLSGKLLITKKVYTNKHLPPAIFLKQICIECEALWRHKGLDEEQIIGIGVGISGLVESEAGISSHAYGIWQEEVAIKEIIENELHIEVFVENNVNAFAFAEMIYGRGKLDEELLLVKWGPGVGSAIVIEHKLYKGGKGKAAELGHMIIDPAGRSCSCGRRGCLETQVSFWGIKESLQQLFSQENTPLLYEKLSGRLEHLNESLMTYLIEEADQVVQELMREKIDIFARAIINSITLLAPSRVVLCGRFFDSITVVERMRAACKIYDSHYTKSFIDLTNLRDVQEFIGPVALVIKERILVYHI